MNTQRFSWKLFNKLRNYSRMMVYNEKSKTAGIIVIGDEILKGEVVDTNSSFMTPKLRDIGVLVKRILVVGDNIDDISSEVKLFSSKYNYVITTGGIGPTHDDVTFEAISEAFEEPLVLHPDLLKICSRFYNTDDVNYPGMKLARVPQSSNLTFPPSEGIELNYPNVSVKNVYMFPGIPQLFQKSFNVLHKKLFQSSTKFYSKVVYFNISEDKIAPYLDRAVKSFPCVLFGSYPDIANKHYKVKVTIEATDEKLVELAYQELLKFVPVNYITAMNSN